MKQIQLYTQKDSIGIVLVGNKCDVENREIKTSEGEALAKEFNLKYFETSALNNLNVEETFNYLSQEVIRIKDYKDNGGKKPDDSIIIEEAKKKNKEKEKKCC